jgi:hypothetical protein
MILVIGVGAAGDQNQVDDKISLRHLFFPEADGIYTWVTVMDVSVFFVTVFWLVGGLAHMLLGGWGMQDAAYNRWEAMGKMGETCKNSEDKIHLDDFKTMWSASGGEAILPHERYYDDLYHKRNKNKLVRVKTKIQKEFLKTKMDQTDATHLKNVKLRKQAEKAGKLRAMSPSEQQEDAYSKVMDEISERHSEISQEDLQMEEKVRNPINPGDFSAGLEVLSKKLEMHTRPSVVRKSSDQAEVIRKHRDGGEDAGKAAGKDAGKGTGNPRQSL